MQDLKVNLVQVSLVWEDIFANLDNIGNIIKKMEPCDLIVLPEMFSTGFSMNAKMFGSDSYEISMRWLKEMVQHTGTAICGSVMAEENGKYYNRFICVKPDGSIQTYDKKHLFTMGGETEIYSAGNELITLEIKGWKIRPLVCYDLRFPLWSRNDNNYDCLIYVANWPEKRIYQWEQLLIARSIENQCYTVGVNRVGKDGNDIYYNGCSLVVNAKGEVKEKVFIDEAVIMATLSWSELSEYRKAFPVLNDRDSFEIK